MAPASARLSAVLARRRQSMAIRQKRCLRGAFGEFYGSDQTVAAAVPPRTAGAFRDFVARDAQRIFAFDRFNWCVERIGHMAMDGVDAVAVRTATRTAAVRLVEAPRSSVGSRSAQHDVAHRAAAAGRNAFGNGASQRTQDDLGVARAGF